MPNEPQHAGRRKTIGLFVDWLDETYQQSMMKGVLLAAQGRDANVYVFEGGAIHSTRSYEVNRNFLYELAGKHLLDGILLLGGSLAHFATPEEMSRFCSRYAPLPLLSIAYQVDGVPSLVPENAEGMRQLVLHFVRAHGLRRIAYVSGPVANNQDARERLEAYLAALREAGLEYDPALIVDGDFTFHSGFTAVKVLRQERKVPFDAVLGANDDMALGAMQALQDQGVRIPREIAVGGFDDNDLAVHASPTLTTVSQSFQEQALRAAGLLLDMIEGKPVSQKTIFPSKLVLRESCGCFSQEVMNAATSNGAGRHPGKRPSLAEAKERIAESLLEKAGIPRTGPVRGHLEMLLGALAAYLEARTTSGELLLAWNDLDRAVPWPEDYLAAAQRLVSELRREVSPYFAETSEKAENFFQQVRIIVAEKANAQEKKELQVLTREFWALHNLTEQILDVFEEQQVTAIICDLLPQLEIPSGFISRFEPGGKRARLIFARENGKRVPPERYGGPFPAADLVPPGLLPAHRRHSLIIEVLCHHEPIGVALFELGPERGRVYGELRRVISTRLQGAILMGQIQAQRSSLRAQSQALSELRKVMGGMIQALSMTVEARDPFTAGHQRRVAGLARAIASEMRLSKEVIEGIRLAATVHDLGKICVPAEILNKPGKLMPAEFNLIKIHPQVAYDILKTIEFPWPIADIVFQHHERLNGSGYPQGLSGEGIKLEARIIGVADVVEAMASHRPYRPAVGLEEALIEIRQNRGALYDADVVDVCLDLFEKGFQFK